MKMRRENSGRGLGRWTLQGSPLLLLAMVLADVFVFVAWAANVTPVSLRIVRIEYLSLTAPTPLKVQMASDHEATIPLRIEALDEDGSVSTTLTSRFVRVTHGLTPVRVAVPPVLLAPFSPGETLSLRGGAGGATDRLLMSTSSCSRP